MQKPKIYFFFNFLWLSRYNVNRKKTISLLQQVFNLFKIICSFMSLISDNGKFPSFNRNNNLFRVFRMKIVIYINYSGTVIDWNRYNNSSFFSPIITFKVVENYCISILDTAVNKKKSGVFNEIIFLTFQFICYPISTKKN